MIVIYFDSNGKRIICFVIKSLCFSKGFIDETHLNGYIVQTVYKPTSLGI